jgi:hypothetical protein
MLDIAFCDSFSILVDTLSMQQEAVSGKAAMAAETSAQIIVLNEKVG